MKNRFRPSPAWLPKWKQTNNDDQVARAKKYPIQKMYEGKLRQVGRVEMGLCPFHSEDTPSFAIYPENNTWHCFAEGIGGDAIDYFMRKTGVNFVQAVKEMQ